MRRDQLLYAAPSTGIETLVNTVRPDVTAMVATLYTAVDATGRLTLTESSAVSANVSSLFSDTIVTEGSPVTVMTGDARPWPDGL